MNIIYYKRKPKECPSCGFKPLATILYGYPIFDDKMKDKISRGLIILGSCDAPMNISPTWQCPSCEEYFHKINKHDTYLRFEINHYMSGYVEFIYINGEAYIRDSFTGVFNSINIYPVTFAEFTCACEEIDIFNWEKEYDNPMILDGTGWELELNLNGKYFESSGINEYPKKFDEFQMIVEKLFNYSFDDMD